MDDNATNRRILTALLARWAVRTREPLAGAGTRLDRAGEAFDVALLDLVMPETDGVVLATAGRGAAGARRIILVLSAGVRERRHPAVAAFLSSP